MSQPHAPQVLLATPEGEPSEDFWGDLWLELAEDLRESDERARQTAAWEASTPFALVLGAREITNVGGEASALREMFARERYGCALAARAALVQLLKELGSAVAIQFDLPNRLVRLLGQPCPVSPPPDPAALPPPTQLLALVHAVQTAAPPALRRGAHAA